MTDFMGIIVVIVAIACMVLAQRQSTSKANKRLYSFLGSAASIMVAVEAANRSEPGVMFLFAGAAAFSLLGIAFDYFTAAKPDA